MTTQSAMRMVEGDHVKNWQASRDSRIFGSLDMAVEDLGFLMKRNRLDSGDNNTGKFPNRSGSAPPSMEGSFAALRHLLKQQEASSSEVLSRAIENYDSEEEIRSDPAYVAYYLSNVNLNPRLPPPLISRENQHLLRHLGGVGDNSQSPTTSWDNMGLRSSLHSSRTALSTHREEPEDEASSAEQQAYASLAGHRKSLADMIQRPHSAGNRPIAQDIHAISSDTSSETTRRLLESDISSVNLLRETDSLSMDAITSEDPFSADLGSQSSSANAQKERLNASVFGASPPSSAASRMMMRIQDNQQPQGRGMPLQYIQSSYQVQPSSPQQMTYPRMGGTQDMMQSLPKIATGEVHSTFQSPHGLAPPAMYSSTAAYMTSLNPFYHQNFQSSGMYLPQYIYNGYPPGSGVVPQYMSGYASHEATVPMPYDISSASSGYNNARLLPGVSSTGQNVPSLVDPYQLQYFQQAPVDAYAPSFQTSNDSFGQKDLQAAGYMANHEPLNSPLSPSYGLQSPRHMGNYFAVPPGVRVMPQYPGSPLASPVMPSSPVGGMMSHFGRRSETRYHQQGPSRNTGIYPGGWQGNRGGGANSIVDDHKRHSFLDELKSPNARKLELSDIAGRVVEFSVDQHGSRFIQQKLEHCSDEEKASVYSELLPQASKLMTDVFGNYVIQKFIEHGTPAQREELVKQLAGQMVSLSLQMYGCRVIQKALEVIDVDQKTELIRELDGNVMKCVRDQNGNHVIQKCIESMPAGRIGFVIAAFRGQVATLSTHPYGCRVIQRILEHCSDDEETHCIIDEILESTFALAHDQYGNYVTQHVLERGKPDERSQIIEKLTGNVVQMSQHKYASNVVEKCLEHADSNERELLIEEIMGKSEEDNHLLAMMKDQFANYVVQKVLEISKDQQREILVQRMKIHLQSLRKYTYGKHIVARFEQLFGEESEVSEEGTEG
ncbi:PREDICTED: pumilio homolog 5-like isoform X1 [Camelina sativa]|uniref:Pumilio homolog 5-like isoform X1 n=1 Tax=Camelina sativa TaxID=90675 RepID=A0ABM0Z0F5_CAMSA|nr:PREDICTED: pumilio homolog 5-like isoform X1 [Camelina sativa]